MRKQIQAHIPCVFEKTRVSGYIPLQEEQKFQVTNQSDRIIEHIYLVKGLGKPGFIFHFFLARLHICVVLQCFEF